MSLSGALARLPFSRGLFDAYHALRSLRWSPPPPLAPDGRPFPPRRLMYAVVSHADAEAFFATGIQTSELVRDAFVRHGGARSAAAAMLDFGAGCGRVIRHVPTWFAGSLFGVDTNRESMRWCARNLPFATFRAISRRPPLPFADASFDAVYGFSVFTHLSREPQATWVRELGRVLKPGGLVWLTFHDQAFAGRIADLSLRQEFDRTGFVTTPGPAGSNVTATIQAASTMTEVLESGGLTVLEVDGGVPTQEQQAVVVARR